MNRWYLRPRTVALTGGLLAAVALLLVLVLQSQATSEAAAPMPSQFAVFENAPAFGHTTPIPHGMPVDPDSARLVQESAAAQVYVVDGPGLVCVGVRLPEKAVATGCSTIDAAIGGRPPVVTIPVDPSGKGSWIATTLVPNGTEEVVFNGETRVPVENNTAVVKLDTEMTGLSFSTADGARHTVGRP